jgi:hypothetical protein
MQQNVQGRMYDWLFVFGEWILTGQFLFLSINTISIVLNCVLFILAFFSVWGGGGICYLTLFALPLGFKVILKCPCFNASGDVIKKFGSWRILSKRQTLFTQALFTLRLMGWNMTNTLQPQFFFCYSNRHFQLMWTSCHTFPIFSSGFTIVNQPDCELFGYCLLLQRIICHWKTATLNIAYCP